MSPRIALSPGQLNPALWLVLSRLVVLGFRVALVLRLVSGSRLVRGFPLAIGLCWR